MNNYLKPQSPIKDKDGDYLYPLTTADQVIMEDGRRLNVVIGSGVADSIVPTPTLEDNGKILKVINGAPVWANIPSAEEGSF